MSERYIKYKQYKNISIDTDNENNKHCEKLVLNSSLENTGELVILIGPNNVGKSNILSSLLKLNTKMLTLETDKPSFYGFEKVIPELSLVCNLGDARYIASIDPDGIDYDYIGKDRLEKPKWTQEEILQMVNDWIIKILETAKNDYSEKLNSGHYYGNQNYRQLFLSSETALTFFKNLKDYSQFIENDNTDSNGMMELKLTGNISNYLEIVKIAYTELTKEIKYNYVTGLLDLSNKEFFTPQTYNLSKMFAKHFKKYTKISDTFFNNYKINLVPNVFEFTEKNVDGKELICRLNPDEEPSKSINVFFENLIVNMFDIPTEQIDEVFEKEKQGNYPGVIRKLEKQVNEKLKEVEKHFNDIYDKNKSNYKFYVNIEESKLSFSMMRNEEVISLKNQSEGFKWFFNFYFDFLLNNEINEGDIITIDEAGSKLHPQGCIEFRNFLKNFAIDNKVTIVIATHSPFMIDNDHLEEVRVIKQEGKSLKIYNKFTVNEIEENNVTKSILEALTVNKHVIFNPENKIIFVEGITDYCYLTAFKKFFKLKNVFFLPFQGVKDPNKVYSEVTKFKKDAIFLVDGDSAGESFAAKVKETQNKAITLKEIDSSFTVIEDLFGEELKEKYISGKKSFNDATQLKNAIEFEEGIVDEKTKANFKKVFEKIMYL